MSDDPPVAKYRYTVEIRANSHDEIERELLLLVNGGHLMHSDYHKRDEFESWGGRKHVKLEHTNPEQTPEAYDAELQAWASGRRAERRRLARAETEQERKREEVGR